MINWKKFAIKIGVIALGVVLFLIGIGLALFKIYIAAKFETGFTFLPFLGFIIAIVGVVVAIKGWQMNIYDDV
ncbi:hypothetical protein NDQ54_16135 [Lactiplantibacillus plantarum]|uniref:hypothetical protein n=1 Tax=Lactiplantibacillus plantarum TaxID=1590 RepID=UPI0006A6588D|nr:hypothetical protein [Lactiplantibacillus plantarum]MDN5583334.1 hypothetical protein [Lactobacillus sp.]KOE73746.1 hypothetical protein AB662_00585 [Lactiplantibacillus plantarum]MBW4801127.1 hypothetical protein [Lactiplantibacillus plantarum]MBW4809421.1 hypothetical protein [Lactiplantibacillus plantarum]MBW4812368.1 hypothetical protein [Lactiplantibacillus plantarum]